MSNIFDPDLISFLPVSLVSATLESAGARFTKVSFVKKDGTVTTRVGRPKTYSRRVGGANGPAANPVTLRRAEIAAKSLVENGNVFLDYPQPRDGKTGFAFNRGRVVAIGKVGTHPTPE